MEDIVLPNTSLCAIVRDEMMNSAGGIRRFLRSVMPHVEAGVVVDTGSVDGTRESLEEAKREFPNLRVYDTKFEGYAQARNFSLRRAETERALILDADEIIKQEDYESLSDNIAKSLNKVLCFGFIGVNLSGEGFGSGHIHRLIPSSSAFWNNGDWKWEYLVGNPLFQTERSGVDILHFRISYDLQDMKSNNWYGTRELPKIAPSQTQGFEQWKAFNPRRNNYKGSNLDIPEPALAKAV